MRLEFVSLLLFGAVLAAPVPEDGASVAYAGSTSTHTGLLLNKKDLQDQVAENERFPILSSKSKHSVTNPLLKRGQHSTKAEGPIKGIDDLDQSKMTQEHLKAWRTDRNLLKKKLWPGGAGKAERKAYINNLRFIPRPDGPNSDPFHAWAYNKWYTGGGIIKGDNQYHTAYDLFMHTPDYDRSRRPGRSPPPPSDSSSEGEGEGKKKKNPYKKMSLKDHKKKADKYNRKKIAKPEGKGKEPVGGGEGTKDGDSDPKVIDFGNNSIINTAATDFVPSSR